MKKIKFNSIKKYAYVFITSLCFSIVISSCCTQKCFVPNKRPHLENGKYIRGFVFIPADNQNKNGIIRLFSEGKSLDKKITGHNAPGLIYTTLNVQDEKYLERRQLVYCKAYKTNDGFYAAYDIIPEEKFDVTQDHATEISINFNCMNLHKMFNHPENPNHKFGHIKNISQTQITNLPSNPTYNFHLATERIKDQVTGLYQDPSQVWVPQQYSNIDSTNYYIEYEDFRLEDPNDSTKQLRVIMNISLDHHHITSYEEH